MNVTSKGAVPQLLALPTELRLHIYAYINGGICSERIHVNAIGQLQEARSVHQSHLIKLGQTCRKLYEEIEDFVYAKKSSALELVQAPSTANFETGRLNLVCLQPMRIVHLHFSIDEIVECHDIVDGALNILEASTKLKICTVKFGFPCLDGSALARLENELGLLRRLAIKEGVRDGRNAKDRELDYAKRIIDHLLTAL